MGKMASLFVHALMHIKSLPWKNFITFVLRDYRNLFTFGNGKIFRLNEIYNCQICILNEPIIRRRSHKPTDQESAPMPVEITAGCIENQVLRKPFLKNCHGCIRCVRCGSTLLKIYSCQTQKFPKVSSCGHKMLSSIVTWKVHNSMSPLHHVCLKKAVICPT